MMEQVKCGCYSYSRLLRVVRFIQGHSCRKQRLHGLVYEPLYAFLGPQMNAGVFMTYRRSVQVVLSGLLVVSVWFHEVYKAFEVG